MSPGRSGVLCYNRTRAMKQIWSPWRMDYIEGRNTESGCLFCNSLAQEDGPENLVLHRGLHAFVILNRYPYTNGHVMIVPVRHVATVEDLDEADLAELMFLARRSLAALRAAYGCEAFNLGANIGSAAGAGVADHVHLHVVPRWPGDTNFMATTGGTRVIPEELPITYNRLAAAWAGTNDQS
jgi:ATP adenylyltransferase